MPTLGEASSQGESMKIAMIAPFACTPKATVSARAVPIAQALTHRGHQVTVWVPPYDHLEDAGTAIVHDTVQIYNLPLKRVTALTPLRAAWQLASCARRYHPDIVHIFKPVGYAALAGMILRRTSRLPIVTDSDDWEGTGGWNSINPYPWHWKRFFDFQERWLPRHSAAVTVASRTLQTQMWGLGIPQERVFYVPNCPAPSFLRARAQVHPSDRARVRAALDIGDGPVAIYVGHITRGDDLDLAVAAFKRVIARLPDARLVIVGTGEGLEALRSFAAEIGVEHAVIFAGWIDHRSVPAYLSAADVAVYPYRDSLVHRAKCSIKILEYMTMGKAIVTHRVGQNTEYLEHGRSGILADPGSITEFAEGLLAVLTDRAYAERLGSEASRRIEQCFMWAQRVDDVERAYQLAGAAMQAPNG
jgi:glycosyltransferase involved in cell wall biosynthesis